MAKFGVKPKSGPSTHQSAAAVQEGPNSPANETTPVVFERGNSEKRSPSPNWLELSTGRLDLSTGRFEGTEDDDWAAEWDRDVAKPQGSDAQVAVWLNPPSPPNML